MKTIKIGRITLQQPESAKDRAALTAKWQRGQLDVGMAERMHPSPKGKR